MQSSTHCLSFQALPFSTRGRDFGFKHRTERKRGSFSVLPATPLLEEFTSPFTWTLVGCSR